MNPSPHPFDDLTLAQLIDRLVRSPVRTTRAVFDYFATAPLPAQPLRLPTALPMSGPPDAAQSALETDAQADSTLERATTRDWVLLLAQLIGLTLAWAGTGIMAFGAMRTEGSALNGALPLALVGALVWLAARLASAGTAAPAPTEARELVYALPVPSSVTSAFNRHLSLRLMLVALAVMASLVTYVYSVGNLFRVVGVVAWVLSIVLWVQALAPSGWSPLYPVRRWLARLRGVEEPSLAVVPGAVDDVSAQRPARSTGLTAGVTLALIAILVVGAAFRLTDIRGTPPEMTSDHVEKLLDSQRVYEGTYNIYFQNNGGREPLQMYVMAGFVGLTGQPMNFDTLKLLTALEGILTLPIFFWLGRELVGRHDRRLGVIVGLALVGLVAVSYWHVALSRLALRIIYTPGITALIFIYLSRALRDNRRIDYINTGLALGAGLYMYQVVRILPVVIVLGVVLAILISARTWAQRQRYLLNLGVLVLVSFAVFMPLFRFSIDYPDDFWRRTSGRLFGDDLTQVTDEDGNLVERVPTLEERISAFRDNLPVLTSNIRNALLMYTWKGDVAWISAAPNQPAFDPLAAALLVVGLGAWIGWIVRKRDAALWLVLPAWFILIFPSALSIAYPIENPSATRMSGTLPLAYLMAAFALGLLVVSIRKVAPPRLGLIASAVLVVAVLGISYGANAQTYFGEYQDFYRLSSKPYSSAGALLRQFATNEGSYGNAFMIAYPYWWDHRAIGIEGGRIRWDNGIVSRDDVPRFLRDALARGGPDGLDLDRPLLFMYSPDDVDTDLRLRLWFPDGFGETLPTSHPDEVFRVYTVPPLRAAGFAAFLDEYLDE